MKAKRFLFRAPTIFGTPLKYGAPVFIGFTVLISGLEARGGDILRGGSSASNKPGRAGANTRTAAATDAARANAKDTLARTNKTLASIRAMQNAARQAALKNGANHLGKNPLKPTLKLPDLPNGLVTGGLKVSGTVTTDPTQWTGAKLPVQEVKKNGKTTVTIKQTEQQALLNWETFNVGKKTTVTFDQSKGGADVGKWIAFNKITDPSGNPTQILGNIKADGQIYLINTNGIIFGAGSQVNARGLTASSLPINTNLIDRGLLNNPDAQFLFSGLAIPAGTNGTPAFTPEAPVSADGKYGDVIVEKGAVLKSPTDSANTGGRITLVGPNVTNDGTILTPDGQTILAAGLQVGFDAHVGSDPSLRGLDVYIGSVTDAVAGTYAGTVIQSGLIESQRGSITIGGREIEQTGALVSTTSVSLNGRIDLLAHYNAITNPNFGAAGSGQTNPFLNQESGHVSLGEESVISILPEWESKETNIGTELALRSQVNVAAKTVYLGRESLLLSPNALVNINAGDWLVTGSASTLTSRFVQSSGQVYLDSGAVIDVSGSADIVVPVGKNIITVDLRGAELADSPLQREGNLRNASVTVDIRDAGIYQGSQWIGTPLANISGFANLIQRSVGELTTAGGSVNISAGKSVVMQDSSKVDVSGGSTKFTGGMVNTTRLITADGRLVDISQATPDAVYEGIYDGAFTQKNIKFGVTNVYRGALTPGGNRYEPDSTEGASGGALAITASSMALDGRLVGKTITGDRQRLTPPASSSLTLSFTARDTNYATLPVHAPAPPVITFARTPRQTAPLAFGLDANGDPLQLADERISDVVLSSELMSRDGFGTLEINNHDGKIIVPENVTLETGGGEITLSASNITIEGKVLAPGGSLSFNTYNLTLDAVNQLGNSVGATLPVAASDRGIFTLGSSGLVSTAGLVVDDRLNARASGQLPLFLAGGSIEVNSYTSDLARGGKLDVSGGVYVGPTGDVSYGNAGSLSISAGRDLDITAVLGGTLNLNSTLAGFSGATAGSLTIQAPAIQIGGVNENAGVNLISEDFFSEGGFGSFTLKSSGLVGANPGEFVTGIVVDSTARVRPEVQSLVVDTRDGDLRLRKITKNEGVRPASSISLSASGVIDPYSSAILGRGDVLVESGASIITDAKGAFSASGETVTINGAISTPGGSITIAGAPRFPSLNPDTLLSTVLIGSSARLDASGKTLLVENALGLRRGEVLAGGSITVSGNIVAEGGARFDVSGSSGILDLPPSQKTLDASEINTLSGKSYVPVRIDSNGGRIVFRGSQMLYSDAELLGAAGGDSATGGTLEYSSGRFIPAGTPSTSADVNLVVRQNGSFVPEGFVSQGPGNVIVSDSGAPLSGIGNVTVSTFADGGFDSLSLNGNVRFESDVSIKVPGALRVGSGGVIEGDSRVKLSAGYIFAGQAFAPPSLAGESPILFTRTDSSGTTSPHTFAPTHGSGSIAFKAGLIDIGNLSLQQIGDSSFTAADGDIRGNGTLGVAGSIDFKAGQIYPTTAGFFNVFAYDHASAGGIVQGSVSISGGTTRPLPLSAGGTLGIYASRITQGGVLRAPIGTINLGWDGSGTTPFNPMAGTTVAAPITSLLTLSSGSTVSVSAIDPATGEGLRIPYGISFDGSSWIDPAGNEITVSGLPGKTVNLSGENVVTEKDSTIDITGGGELFAYRWISGNGGTKDVLASNNSFAIIPGYNSLYSPYAPFNPSDAATNLGGEPGYVNSTLKAGDQITLAASEGIPAGSYTLLPARYALLPGAYLVTPKSGTPAGTVGVPEGATIVAGYRSNNLDGSRVGPTTITRFEIASRPVVRARSKYEVLLANTVIRETALARDLAVARLPMDAGYLSFTSNLTMELRGDVASAIQGDGRGSVIDINSAADILINESGTGGETGELVLSSRLLNSFDAESLLVGGLRTFGPEGSTVSFNSGNVTLDNAGSPITGADVIFVARENLTLAKNSVIEATGGDESLDTLLLGDADVSGSGDGALVRVSGSLAAPILRAGVSSSVIPDLAVRSGARLNGGSIVMDSTSGTDLSATALIKGSAVSLSSGQISIRLKNPGGLNATSGLVLSGNTLDELQKSADTLSLLSYSSLDVYGSGAVGSRSFEGLSLQAASIRGFHTSGEVATFSAKTLRIENAAGRPASAALQGGLEGTIKFDAEEIVLGANNLTLDGYADSKFIADKLILVSGEGGIRTAGAMELITPLVTGESAAKYQIAADGTLLLNRPASSAATLQPGGFGTELTLEGAQLMVNSDISLPSGQLSLHATTGDVIVGNLAEARLNLEGDEIRLLDVSRYTSGGIVNLISDKGDVKIAESAEISVAAHVKGGNAGGISFQAPEGSFEFAGGIDGSAGTRGLKGTFSLDVSSVAGGSLAALDGVLNSGKFTQSRSYRIRTGDVNIDGLAKSAIYRVVADAGNIVVSDTIDSSGDTGGVIDLKSSGSLILKNGALLDASGDDFDSAGKGGAITLEAGNQVDGLINTGAMLDLREGAEIDLSVADANPNGESLGRFSGTLHLRAPRTADNKDLQIEAIGSTITGASSILVEGAKSYALTGSGTITTALQNTIRNEATAFLGGTGTTTAGYTAVLNRLTAAQPGLDLILAPGVEIYNLNGNLTLGTATPTATSDWNLATWRFGPKGAAGVLTLRASDNIILHNAISDGFNGGTSLWLAPLLANNPLLLANSQSWSLRFTAGADLSAASFRAVRSIGELGTSSGILQLGKNAGSATVSGGANARTSSLITSLFQVIRTGSGDIDINTGRSLQLLNPFASIYTAGTRLTDATTVSTLNDFVVPIIDRNVAQGNLGSAQQNYLAQYSMAGGNVTITAGENIERKSRNNDGLVDDSSRQLPNNWLYRRGYLDSDGTFGDIRIGSGFSATTDQSASTTWWVDFSNFFQGVGALGGGNVVLSAGRDVNNMDAVIPTNARAAGGVPSARTFVELGGGDLHVTSGNDINGGVYYVERGNGILDAGGSITTNGTRSPSFGLVGNLNNPSAAQLDPLTWMPTTLFVGKSSFDLTAAGDLLLGPVSNPFLLPQGIGNKFWYKTYFSTIAPDSEVTALSLGGDVTYRNAVTVPSQTQAQPMLRVWHETQLLFTGSTSSTSWFQPWLRLAETSLDPFAPVWSLSAASLSLTSLTADLNLAGDLTTFPASKGQLELLAAQSINALQPTGLSKLASGGSLQNWFASTINLSDANPSSIPQQLAPLTSVTPSTVGAVLSSSTVPGFLNGLTTLFSESGSVTGTNAVLQTRQARHTPGGLHRNDEEPLRIYALDGDLSGLTLYSGKQARISASTDITDVGFYIQNNDASDATVITAGRDIVAYNSASNLRLASLSDGNILSSGQTNLSGDIQISGPGVLQVLAGRNLDLGTGSGNADGTGTGITSIGNLRNPYLTAAGASLIVGAGIGPATGLAGSSLDFGTFITEFGTSPKADRYLAEAKGILGVATVSGKQGIQVTEVSVGGAADDAGVQEGDILLRISGNKIGTSYDDSYLKIGNGIEIGKETKLQVLRDGKRLTLDIKPGSDLLDLADPLLSAEQQKQLALSVLYLALRDAGRDFNNVDSADYQDQDYPDGFAAIKALFPKSVAWAGEILTQSRDIRTRSGGDVSIFAPGGGLTMANTTIGNPLTPPGIVTESGGDIAIFTDQSVDIGIGRIFTLKGGNAVIWSSKGDIAAGSSSRTVSAAPPTRVIVDPQSASVETDLAGLATGGGIGVLATVEGVEPGNVDLIAPAGVIDAGDAGIRVSGNINLAAISVVNAGNIAAGGTSSGSPTTSVSGPSISTVTNAANAVAANNEIANKQAEQTPPETKPLDEDSLSVITVDVIGYGDGGADEDEDGETEGQENSTESGPALPGTPE